MLRAKLIKEGYLPENTPNWNVIRTPLIDQNKLMALAATSLTGAVKLKMQVEEWDTCAECGTMYCIKLDLVDQDAKVSVQPGAAPPFRNTPPQRRP